MFRSYVVLAARVRRRDPGNNMYSMRFSRCIGAYRCLRERTEEAPVIRLWGE